MINDDTIFFPSYLKMRREKDILFVLNKNMELFSLNNTALEIFEMIIEKYTFSQILEALLADYNVDYDVLKLDLSEVMNYMIKCNIIAQ